MSSTKYKKTRAYIRFSEYLADIEKANSKEDILNAGFSLLFSYKLLGTDISQYYGQVRGIVDKLIEEQNGKRITEKTTSKLR